MESIAIRTKSIYNYLYYDIEAHGVHIGLYNNKLWFYIDEKFFTNLNDFVDCINDLVKDYTKETMIFYTFDLKSVLKYIGYLLIPIVDNRVYGYLAYQGNNDKFKVEFRSLKAFVNSYDDAKNELNKAGHEGEIAKAYAQMLYDTYFIPDKKWYLSPHQRSRRLVDKASDNSIKENWPSWNDYQNLRYECFRGGLCFNTYKSYRLKGDFIHLDRTSAYPAELLLNRFPMGKWKYADETKWHKYNNVSWYGHFIIKYSIDPNRYKYLKLYNIDSEKHEIDLWLTDVDMDILHLCLKKMTVKCVYLKTCEKDFLPKYYLDFVYEAYKRKVEAKNNKDPKGIIAQRKREVNAIYGNLIRNIENYDNYKNLSRATRPEWGIWCTAYERLALISFAIDCDDSMYGDTDSNFCLNTDKTKAALKAYNTQIDNKIVELCARTGYDYNILQDIGTFKEEDYVIDFIANKQKQYGYIDSNGNEIIHCSGYKDGTVTYENLINHKMPEIKAEINDWTSGNLEIKEVSPMEYIIYEQINKINKKLTN